MGPGMRYMIPLLLASAWAATYAAPQRPAQPDAAPKPVAAPGAREEPAKERPAAEEAPQETPEEIAAKYFEQADLDHNGWVLFGEAGKTMGIDKKAFAAFDRDLDFRISREEYAQRYVEITTRGGAFPAPRSADSPAPGEAAGAEQLLLIGDEDGNKAIDELELRALLLRQERAEFDPQVVVTQLDRDSDKRLKGDELDDLAHLLDPRLPRSKKDKARSIDELFGKRIPREEREGAIRLPDQIQGPVDSFRRLDYDGDGRITEAELGDLLRPVQTSARLAAVFATLDRNRDGWLSREEFWSALGS